MAGQFYFSLSGKIYNFDFITADQSDTEPGENQIQKNWDNIIQNQV